MASRHIIEECVNKSQSSQNRCTYQVPSNATSIILTCVVSGFKPDISMMWTDESGERIQSMASLQTTLSDDTYERFEKINVSANHGTEQTFACIATGDSVNGTSSAEITLLPVSGKRDNGGLTVGLVVGISAAVFILSLLVRGRKNTSNSRFHGNRIFRITVRFFPVNEESSPTAQTTMTSEDDSRKWYSVQWVDFKLCCRRLRDVSAQHPRIPFWLYALYRFTLAAYFFAILIALAVFAEKTLGPKFAVFLEFWTLINATCYFCFAFLNVVMDCMKSMMNTGPEDKLRYQIQWLLFNITATPCLIVLVFNLWIRFYAPLFGVPKLFTVSIYDLPPAVCLIEIFVSLMVVRFVHVVYPFSYLLIYLFFAVIYWVAGGTDPFGNPFIYFYLDFENTPGITAATVVAVAFGTLLFQAIFKGLYAIRVRCMDKRRTEAVPPTEQVEAVELERLTA
ncbi:uncharacterized protein [Diadema setosum]|uniref:uncharacterized protein n=1 Tax=Diadema setosum TaxID=31175 RepID=UPI003B3ACFE5